ncbi:MAG: ATP-grasp domain-containing protein [Aureliella sp.]
MSEVSQFDDNPTHFRRPNQGPREAAPVLCAIGFSCRGLVEAIHAAGFPAMAIDHFGDHDLRLHCHEAPRVISWEFDPLDPDSKSSRTFCTQLRAAIGGLPSNACFVLAGGTENLGALFSGVFDSPDSQARRGTTALAPSGQQVELLRDPENLALWCEDLDVGFPSTVSVADKVHNFGTDFVGGGERRWLQKTRFSGGGIGVFELSAASLPTQSGVYIQQYVPGVVLGVTFCLTPQNAPIMLGATRALTYEDWPGPLPFIYRGTVGPLVLAERTCEQLSRLASRIQERTGLRGWLQMDIVMSPDGRLWLLEINPRWTAGMEVLARSGTNPVLSHLAAYGVTLNRAGDALDAATREQPGAMSAKAILYADRDYDLSVDDVKRLQDLRQQSPSRFADIPSIHQIDALAGVIRVPSGHPICTLRAERPWEPIVPTASNPGGDAASSSKIDRELLQRLQVAREKALSLLQ